MVKIGAVLWLAACAFGFSRLVVYQSAAGSAGEPPSSWPGSAAAETDAGRNTLLLFAHPRCPCTAASLDELAWALSRDGGRSKAHVFFYKPAAMEAGWERTALWRKASAIPGVSVSSDLDGAEARRFGAATSGQTLLYGPDGALRFQGGVTGGRGHAGDNEGRRALLAASRGEARASSRVFGCLLMRSSDG